MNVVSSPSDLLSRAAIAGVAALLIAVSGSAIAVQQVVRFRPADYPGFLGYNNFGWSVSLEGKTALVAATHSGWGAIWFYRDLGLDNWVPVQRIQTPQSGSSFGWSASLSNSTALIGAPSYNWPHGAAYVFNQDQSGLWYQSDLLTPSTASGQFGDSVSLDDSLALIGGYGTNQFNGAAWVFRKDQDGSWNEVAMLRPISPVANFGTAVAIKDSTALIGATAENNLIGAAYIYKNEGNDNWKQTARLAPAGITSQSDFGYSVALEQKTAIVGAPFADGRSGAAFVYREDEFGNWSQVAELRPTDADVSDTFGWSVSLHDSTALVGSFSAAYLFRENSAGQWQQLAKITSSEVPTGGLFGYSVAISGSHLLISDLSGIPGGVAYVFLIPEPSSSLLILIATIAITLLRGRQVPLAPQCFSSRSLAVGIQTKSC